MAMSESSTRSRIDGNTSVSCWPFCNSRMTIARGLSGTRWDTFAFIRSDGMVHTLSLKSTSLQVIPLASPERQAVRITNSSNERTTSGRLPGLRCCCTNAGISRQGMAGWCWVRTALPGCCARRWGTTSTGLDWQCEPPRGGSKLSLLIPVLVTAYEYHLPVQTFRLIEEVKVVRPENVLAHLKAARGIGAGRNAGLDTAALNFHHPVHRPRPAAPAQLDISLGADLDDGAVCQPYGHKSFRPHLQPGAFGQHRAGSNRWVCRC